MMGNFSTKDRIFLVVITLAGIFLTATMFAHLLRDSSKVGNWGRSGIFETSMRATPEDSLLVFDIIESYDFKDGLVPQEGDTLVTVNGEPATVDLYNSLVQRPKDPDFEMSIEYTHLGQERTVTMAVNPVPNGRFAMMLGMHITRFLIGFAFLVVGFIALSKQPASPEVRVLVLFTFSMAAFVLNGVAYINSYYATVFADISPVIIAIVDLFTIFIGGFWLHLHLRFPHQTRFIRKVPVLAYIVCYGPGIVYYALYVSGIADRTEPSTVINLTIAAQFAAGFTLLGFHHGGAHNALEKRQTKLVMMGSTIAMTPLYLVILLQMVYPEWMNAVGEANLLIINVILLCLLTMPITFFYAFSRYGLLDVEAKLRRGTRHFLITAGILAAFFVVVYFIGDLMLRQLNVVSRTPTILIAMILTLAVHPAQRQLTNWIERRFYPARHQLQAMLDDLTERLSTFPDRDALWRQISSRLRHAVGVEHLMPIMRDHEDCFRVHNGKLTPFTMKDDLLRRLERERRPILLDEAMASMRIPFTDGQIRWISENQVNLVLPMFVRGRLVGFIAFGRSTRKQDYTPEIVQVLHSMMQQVALTVDNLRLLEENLEKKRLEDELKLARSIQEGFLPQDIPETPGLDIGARSRFSLEVAGDYFDVIALPGGRTVVALGDVSGKGAGAALIMANLQAALRALVHINADLQALVSSINDIICQNTPAEDYITFVVGIYDPQIREFEYVNAGHNSPLLVRRDGKIEELTTGGLILGVQCATPYDVGKVSIEEDDMLFFYTDGISEAMNHKGEEYGERRIAEFISAENGDSCAVVVEKLEREVLQFHGKSNLEDDCTMVLARVMRDGYVPGESDDSQIDATSKGVQDLA